MQIYVFFIMLTILCILLAQWIPIHPDSQKWLTINTYIGLYMFQRCPNGIHTALTLLQEIMDKTLAGVPHTITYLDDVLVAGINQADHDANLCAVFDRLRTAGFKLNKSKCTFNKSSVTYLATGGGGVEHLSTPSDFERIFFRGGWLPLN